MAKEKPEPSTTPAPEPPPTDTNQLLASVLMKLAERPSGVTPEQLQEILENTAASTRKALRPEVPLHPDVSDFNPLGERDHPRPPLHHRVIFAGIPLDEDDLKLSEIELLNKFTHSCVARNGAWRADVKPGVKGGKGELVISLPVATMDDRMDLPNGMSLILTELLGGDRAADPATLAERVAELERQLAAKS